MAPRRGDLAQAGAIAQRGEMFLRRTGLPLKAGPAVCHRAELQTARAGR